MLALMGSKKFACRFNLNVAARQLLTTRLDAPTMGY
jgi:hypothetical protein